jgi:acyl-CoA-binding protein
MASNQQEAVTETQNKKWSSKPMSKKDVFMQAVLHFAKSENALGANTDEKIQLYGLYKQSMRGDCGDKAPANENSSEFFQWQSWESNKGLSDLVAMDKYVDVVKELDDDFIPQAMSAKETLKKIPKVLKKRQSALGLLGGEQFMEVTISGSSMFHPEQRDRLIQRCDAVHSHKLHLCPHQRHATSSPLLVVQPSTPPPRRWKRPLTQGGTYLLI